MLNYAGKAPEAGDGYNLHAEAGVGRVGGVL